MQLSDAIVLLVDDEPELREIMAQWLTFAGCGTVKTAADGKAALAILGEARIDLLITDIRMPEMDGITLVRRLYEAGGAVPGIVFISGFGDIDEREMYGLGVEAFLSKPLGREEMIGAMQRAIAERSALWLTPMAVAPKQSLHLRDAEIGGADSGGPDAGSAGGLRMHPSVCLGRGGFSLEYAAPLSLGKVAFRCGILGEQRDCGPARGKQRQIGGQGLVRWRSRADGKVGIEFAWLDPACRAWVIGEIGARRPRSFIPSG